MFLSVAVKHRLRKDGKIDGNLKSAAHAKLNWGMARNEVERFEAIAGQPHEDHSAAAVKKKKTRQYVNLSSWEGKNKLILPHSKCRLCNVVVVELWQSKHSFDEQRCKTEELDVKDVTDKKVRQDGSDQREGSDELDIRAEISPLPEIAGIEICAVVV